MKNYKNHDNPPYSVPGTLLIVLYILFPWSTCLQPYLALFSEKKYEAQRGKLTCPRPPVH